MRLEETVVVDRPIDDVWAFLTDTFNAPRLRGRHWLILRQTPPGSPGVGSSLQGRMVILGFEMRLSFLITEWDPPQVLATSMTGRPFRSAEGRVTLETIGNGTKIVRWFEVEPRGPLSLVLPFIWPFARRLYHAETQHLKTFIEGKPRWKAGGPDP